MVLLHSQRGASSHSFYLLQGRNLSCRVYNFFRRKARESLPLDPPLAFAVFQESIRGRPHSMWESLQNWKTVQPIVPRLEILSVLGGLLRQVEQHVVSEAYDPATRTTFAQYATFAISFTMEKIRAAQQVSPEVEAIVDYIEQCSQRIFTSPFYGPRNVEPSPARDYVMRENTDGSNATPFIRADSQSKPSSLSPALESRVRDLLTDASAAVETISLHPEAWSESSPSVPPHEDRERDAPTHAAAVVETISLHPEAWSESSPSVPPHADRVRDAPTDAAAVVETRLLCAQAQSEESDHEEWTNKGEVAAVKAEVGALVYSQIVDAGRLYADLKRELETVKAEGRLSPAKKLKPGKDGSVMALKQ